MRRSFHALTAAGAAAALALSGSGLALADTIYNTVDNSVDNGNEQLSVVAGNTATTSIRLSAQEFSGGNLDGSTTCLVNSTNFLLLNLTSTDTTKATAAATSPVDPTKPRQLKFTSCSDSVGQSITVTGVAVGSSQIDVAIDPSSPAQSGFTTNTAKFIANVTAPVVVDTDHDGVPDSTDNCPTVANAGQANADGDNLGDACDPNAFAPAAGTLVTTGASGTEGATLSASGSFTDGDGAGALTITKQAGSGSVTDHHDGTWSWSLTTTDDGSGSVTVSATDGEHSAATQTFSYSATNVAPAGTFGAPASVDEGSPFTLSISSVTDPSSADTTAGFGYAFDCGAGSGYGVASSASSTSCATNDSGLRAVAGKVSDKDAGFSAYTGSVTVNNVAPSGTFNAPASVNEGSAIALSITAVSDPSSADTAAGFTYAFDCGSGYGAASGTSSASCPTTDNGSRDVKAKVFDKDGGAREYSATVTIDNVAPSGTFNAPASVNEGSAIALSITAVSDPSSADTAAGFTYAFDCGSGYGAASGTSSASCPTTDNGSRDVKAKVFDQNGDFNEYTASVTVNNVAPSGTFNAPASVNEGSAIALSITAVSDPSSADTAAGFTYAFDCGSGYGAASSTSSASCATDDDGSRTLMGKVIDKDGGAREYTASVTIANVAPTATFNSPSPVDEGSPIALSLTAVSDPSSADTAAGFTYAFDCGSGYGSASPTASASCPTNDNGSRSVKGKVFDKDGGYSEYGATVTIDNVVPTATFSSPSTVDEGGDIALELSDVDDPSSVDTSSGFSYAFNCGSGYAAASGTSTTTCSTTDDGMRTVKGKVSDKDGGFSEYTGSVTINNVAPSGTFTAPASVNEGSAIALSMTGVTDPSTADTTAGFTYAFDCGSGYDAASATSTASCSTNDNGSRTVRGKVFDKDGGFSEYSASVTINNVAPTATLGASDPVNEGSSIALSLTGANDASTADTAAGFTYAFDCGSGYGAASAMSTASCSTNDNGSRTVRGKVFDKDGGFSEYSASVTINNVAPTGTFNASTPVNEGSAIALSLTGVADPSSVDTAAGFSYAFDCGDGTGYGAATSSSSASCSTNDNGVRTVRGKVIDKDSGEREYTSSVSVDNVAPTIVNPTLSGATGVACQTGNVVGLAFTITDPSSVDTISGTVTWGDGYTTSFTGRSVSLSHSYAPGTWNVSIAASDDDGGVTNASGTGLTVQRNYLVGAIQPPINSDGSSVFKYGSTIPVKVRITDCNSATVPGLSPAITVKLYSSATPNTAVNEDATSTSAADTTGVMRYDASASQYIYNLATKNPSIKDGDAKYTVYVTQGGATVSQNFSLRTK